MARELQDLSFEEWVAWVFDHLISTPEWHFDLEADWWDEERDPERTTGYLTRLFEAPGVLVPKYSDAQITQGLWFLASNSCSNHLFALLAPAVPWAKRARGIRSICTPYRDLFGSRCAT